MPKNRKNYFALTITVAIIIALVSVLFLSNQPNNLVQAASTFGLDNHTSTATTSTNTMQLTLTTTYSNEVLYLSWVGSSGQTISSVQTTGSSPSTSAWTMRLKESADNGGGNYWLETYYAISSTTGTYQVTITMSNTAGSCAALLFGIYGANTASPFDPTVTSAAVGATGASGTTNSQNPSFTTSNANDFMIAVLGVENGNPVGLTVNSSPAYTVIGSQIDGSTSRYTAMDYYLASATGLQNPDWAWQKAGTWGAILDAVQQGPVTEKVTITPAGGYSSSASVTVSGAGASVSSIPMDGALHTFTANPSSTITFTVPTDGSNSRYRFNNAGSASTTWSYTTGASGDTQSNTVYYQYEQTLSYSLLNGGSPTAPTATGKSVSIAYSPSLTTTATGYWFDYSSTSITFSTPTGTNEQWVPNPASISATSANTQVVSMYNQYKQTLSYSLIMAVLLLLVRRPVVFRLVLLMLLL